MAATKTQLHLGVVLIEETGACDFPELVSTSSFYHQGKEIRFFKRQFTFRYLPSDKINNSVALSTDYRGNLHSTPSS